MVPEKLLDVFFAGYPEEQYAKGTCILCADEEPRGVYYIRSGYVRQYTTKSTGESLNLHVYRPGVVMPLMWLFNETSNRYDYDVMFDSVIQCAPRDAFLAFLDKHPELLEHFVRKLLLGIDGLLARMESLVLDDAYTKTVLLFIYLSKAFGEYNSDGDVLINIPLTHKQVASWIGTARETASLQVERLVRERMVTRRQGRYLITDMDTLQATAAARKNSTER